MRLLLAEDEKDLSNALVAILKHNNYSVDAVYNGVDALEYLESEIYDGAILDIMMPQLDGISVLRQIRKKSISVPVLLLTAKSEVDDKVIGLDAGADDYLTKPFDTRELLARIRAITRRQFDSADSILTFGNLSLNRATYELYTETGNFRLTNKEYQVMEMFMLNPRIVLSLERLYEKIWGFDSDAERNVVWVYLSFLRKKLIQLNSTVEIKVMRKSGYMLEETDA